MIRNIYFYSKVVINRAIELRLEGKTYGEINKILLSEFPLPKKVPKGTFSSWFTQKGIRLTPEQEERINKIKRKNISFLQKVGAQAMRKKKLDSFDHASLYAKHTLQKLIQHPNHELLFLSGLYLGEGGKEKRDDFLLANSNISLLKTVLKLLKKNFTIYPKKLRPRLYLRADQDVDKEVEFWSQSLKIPQEQFTKTQKDARTVGVPTWKDYHGVCAISYSDVTIHRFLIALQNEYMKHINQIY